jgi:hypothetical protein
VEAAAKVEENNTASPITTKKDRAGIETGMQKGMREKEVLRLFMSERLHRCHFRGTLSRIHARGHGD